MSPWVNKRDKSFSIDGRVKLKGGTLRKEYTC